MRRIATVFVACLATTAHGAVDPSRVEPNLVIVSTGFGYRILVYSVCSPEHCWSRTYLQSVSLGIESPSIECSTEVTEIALGHVVKDVSWRFVDNAPEASLQAEASHGGFDPRIVTIRPREGCSYEIQGASTTGF